MANKTAPLLPASEALLRRLGERLRLARLRRRLSATQVAERAGMTRVTLRGIERGAPGATLGAYVAVMQVLGIDKDLDLLASADPLGRELQDARLPIREGRRASEQPPPTSPRAARNLSQPRITARANRSPKAARYESARSLAALIKPRQTGRKGR